MKEDIDSLIKLKKITPDMNSQQFCDIINTNFANLDKEMREFHTYSKNKFDTISGQLKEIKSDISEMKEILKRLDSK